MSEPTIPVIVQGATQTITCGPMDTVNLLLAHHVHMTFSQAGRKKLTLTGDRLTVTEHSVSCTLTQAESIKFVPGEENLEIQLNWTYEGGARAATRIVKASVERNLLPEVLE